MFEILEHQAGLDFVRAAPAAASGDHLDPATVAARLAACPGDWRQALGEAVALADFGRIDALLEQHRGSDPALDATLADWAYRFDQESFARALTGVR